MWPLPFRVAYISWKSRHKKAALRRWLDSRRGMAKAALWPKKKQGKRRWQPVGKMLSFKVLSYSLWTSSPFAANDALISLILCCDLRHFVQWNDANHGIEAIEWLHTFSMLAPKLRPFYPPFPKHSTPLSLERGWGWGWMGLRLCLSFHFQTKTFAFEVRIY